VKSACAFNRKSLPGALHDAIRIEFATIPAYLCGWWTIKDPSDPVALRLQRIVVAEMRHMSIVGNVLTALGGTPDIVGAAPRYPCAIPDIWDEGTHGYLRVDLLPFGEDYLHMGKAIERPKDLPQTCKKSVERAMDRAFLTKLPADMVAIEIKCPSIGTFYKAICKAIAEHYGDGKLPDGGRVERQLRYFGPDNITVRTGKEATSLLMDIVDEGEGDGGRGVDQMVWDENGDLSHYYTFDEISRRKSSQWQAYQKRDKPCLPTGDLFAFPEGDAKVCPMAENPHIKDYRRHPELLADARRFNDFYREMVDNLDAGFRGYPYQVQTAVGQMHQLRILAERIFRHPHPKVPGACAGPTFEI
jgi:hypothetical protein